MPHEEGTAGGNPATDADLRARAARVLRQIRAEDVPEPLPVTPAEGEADERARFAFVSALQGIKERLSIPDGAQVVYPGSEVDKTVAEVFGPGHVMHVDPEPDFMEHMMAAGYQTSTETIEDHHPEVPYDVLVARSSYGVPTRELLTRLVRPGGYIIANNYTHWADDVLKCGAPLVGAILPGYDDPEARYVTSPEELAGATDMVSVSYDLGRFNFIDIEPKNPDSLFIFQMTHE